MSEMKKEYIEKIYAGWLAKVIGIRLGAPVEGWSKEQIAQIYGEPDGYVVDYKDFAADDDSNGPLFFLRALEDSGKGDALEAADVADALLNYAPFEHGFFWWGGYGVSTEHTAYLNLRNGIPAPKSGSVEQNGAATAEQIGGQIFIDTWGLVNPGRPDRAAKMAEQAAGVTHGGNGVYGGIFVAACISEAFVTTDIRAIIEKGLSYIPEDCEYTRAVRAVMAWYDAHPKDWEACYDYIFENFGYQCYPGVCHIIPNICVMILSLLYGEGDFDRTLNLCNRCGWDTDCNVGNVAAIMGVRGGLGAISQKKWRDPVHDLLICSSVVGSLNIMDIPQGALYIARLAAALNGETLPAPYDELTSSLAREESCHFEFPGSTHSMRVRTVHHHTSEIYPEMEISVLNTDESAASGERSLKVSVTPLTPGEDVLIYKKTHYVPADFHDSRYDPSFSPLVYPGQTLHGSVMLPDYGVPVAARLYAHEQRSGRILSGESVELKAGEWTPLTFRIPEGGADIIDEIGFAISVLGERGGAKRVSVLVDDFYADGGADYTLLASEETEEVWTLIHREISQFTKLKGLLFLEEGRIHLACSDFGEIYTGSHRWSDYCAEFDLVPVTGDIHQVNVRVQGALRSYAAALLPDGRFGILKNENGYRELASAAFSWEKGKHYHIVVEARENVLRASVNDSAVIEVTDTEAPFLTGGIGLSVRGGSRCALEKIRVKAHEET